MLPAIKPTENDKVHLQQDTRDNSDNKQRNDGYSTSLREARWVRPGSGVSP